MKRCMSIAVIFSLLLLVAAQAAWATANDLKPVGELFSLVNERLSYMKDVAAFKWDKKKAIEDKAREEVVVNKAAEGAGKSGLDVESTKAFFRVQIEAAKEIQRGWHDEWKAKGYPKDQKYADLKTEIRPALISLGSRIIDQIKTALPLLQDKANKAQLEKMILADLKIQYVKDQTKLDLLKALSGIKLAK